MRGLGGRSRLALSPNGPALWPWPGPALEVDECRFMVAWPPSVLMPGRESGRLFGCLGC